jgi:hypothetical protein
MPRPSSSVSEVGISGITSPIDTGETHRRHQTPAFWEYFSLPCEDMSFNALPDARLTASLESIFWYDGRKGYQSQEA